MGDGKKRRIPEVEAIERIPEDSRALKLRFFFVPSEDDVREIHELLKRGREAAC